MAPEALTPLADDLALQIEAPGDGLILRPCPANRMILARTTSRYDGVYRAARASSSFRSAGVNSMRYGLTLGIGVGISADQPVSAASKVRHYICETGYLGDRAGE